MLEIIREALESSVYKPGEASKEKCLEALTALRGLEWKPWEWLPIEQALDGVKLDMVGCHHPGTTKGWLRGSGYYKREAMETGFTHFVILPTPPPQEQRTVGNESYLDAQRMEITGGKNA